MKRRDFILAAPLVGNVRGANDRIVVGQIGLGARGNYEIDVCLRMPDVGIAAVCDVFEPVVDQAVKRIGGGVAGYTDFRRVLERKDIDAVFVSTPDHWHAIPTILACQSGKDVYCEKPLSHTVEEGRRMVAAARAHHRVVQTGSQQRSAPHYRKVVELIRGGYIGKVSAVDCWNMTNEAPDGIGNPPDGAPPTGLNWDMYLGPAPRVPYNPNRFVWNYRWFWDYSNGMLTDWGAHHLDIIHWAMGVDAPAAVYATGGKFVLKDNRETPDTLLAVWEYPGFTVSYTNHAVNARKIENRSYGIRFCGTLGTLVVDRSSYEVVPETAASAGLLMPDAVDRLLASLRGEQLPRARRSSEPLCAPLAETKISIDPSAQEAHVRDFLECIRSRRNPVADVEIGHRSATACLLGAIAYKVGRRIRWDGRSERILDDAQAERLLTKQYRAPWHLPSVG
ncbi:MAG: Gfo/Idh/MocA family oxidoreductase [Bryobacteraceae bacterium]|jgi:predicted dehydrogenase